MFEVEKRLYCKGSRGSYFFQDNSGTVVRQLSPLHDDNYHHYMITPLHYISLVKREWSPQHSYRHHFLTRWLLKLAQTATGIIYQIKTFFCQYRSCPNQDQRHFK